MARIAGWDGGEEATPTSPPTPTATPNITHIDSNPFLFCYQGVACDLTDALTNVRPNWAEHSDHCLGQDGAD